ncbi:MAG: GAF domain-containing protein [Armatimonadetes bacterium]|nr:GAF domain-containing protein [Armatimonadota bacterium]
MQSRTERGTADLEIESLRQQIKDLSSKLADAETLIKDFQQKERATAVRAAGDPAVETAPLSELDTTLRRLVQRIAMILQAEKVLMMFFDPETGELGAIQPAYGVDEDILGMVRLRATHGVSGEVFREGKPVIFSDAVSDPRTKHESFGLLQVRNGLCVPLIIERRDEENRVIDRTSIGVLHVFNKRYGEDFNDEDVRLLERMAKSAASVISNLRLYQAIVEEKEELLQTLESLYAGLMLVSVDGTVSQMNASARALFKVGPEVMGSDYRDIIADASIRELIEETKEGKEGLQVEVPMVGERGERTFQVQAAQVKNEDGRLIGTVTIFNDVTELKSIERMKSAFVATVSHELRTPLTAIKGFVSTLLHEQGFPEEERLEFYAIIDHECDRLTRLISDLLNISRIEAGESLKPDYTNVDIRQLAKKVLMIQKQSTARHELLLDVPDKFPEIIGDEDNLDQVLTNLVSNAIKYSLDGGKVTVHLKVDSDFILIGVEDEGIGIPKEHLSKVFERFHRVHTEDNRKVYGTGLGLFLVKHLVEKLHLGTLWAESEVGVGSTFWVRLPIKLDIEKAEALNK